MSKKHILFHLCEARKALEELIRDLRADPDYDFSNYRVDMGAPVSPHQLSMERT